MAIDKDFLGGVFEGIENSEERINKVLAEFNSDVIGLKRNNEALKTEKEKLAEAQKALSQEKETLETAIKELNEKLESGLPDKEKQFFQTEIDKWKSTAANTTAEMNKQVAERETKIKALEAEHHRYICHAEFNELANADPSIVPVMREPLRKLFFADNEFEWVDVSGEKKLLNKTSKGMKDVLTEFLNSPAGEHFRVSQNTGGGATGSGGGKPSQNMITREQLDAMPPAQKAEFFAKGGRISA